MKTKTNYTFSEQIIIESIDFDGYNVECDNSLFSKINNVYKIFINEYGWDVENRVKRGFNRKTAELISFKEWLQGLPTVLTVPFYNYDILNRAYAHNLIPAFRSDMTKEEIEDKFLSEYWVYLAKAFFTLKENL